MAMSGCGVVVGAARAAVAVSELHFYVGCQRIDEVVPVGQLVLT